MPTYKLAHIHEQGQDLIIIPVDRIFGSKTVAQQNREMQIFQAHATAAGLRGLVVLVWDVGGGRMDFRAPTRWHPFLESITPEYVAMKINRDLSWT
jgi:hypothetical protein